MAYESEDELKKLQMRNSGGIDGTSTVQSDYANGSAAPITPAQTGGYGEKAAPVATRTGGYGENASSKVQAPKKSVVKQAPKKSAPTAKSADEARSAYQKGTMSKTGEKDSKTSVKPASKTTTVYNRSTGQKVTYPTQTSKPKASKPAAATKPAYNRLTGQKIDYTPSKVKSKPVAQKPKPVAPKYNRLTGKKV